MDTPEKRAAIIQHLGGSTKVARRLKFKEGIGRQRVDNWIHRGIPALILLKHKWFFDNAWRAVKAEQEAQHQDD